LNSIQQLILYGNTDGAALYLSKFSKLLRMVLMHSDRDFIHLREELDILHLYLELEALRFEDNFTYTIDCPPELDTDDYQVPPLLIQPFVENAIWHGLMHKEGARRLHIGFDTDADDRLRCTIEDNGIGRNAAASYTRNDHHSGKGVGVGTERIEAINRQYKQHNTLEIVDLKVGTRVEILFQ
jgi:LytS/YehU family sensor histidine kinase